MTRLARLSLRYKLVVSDSKVRVVLVPRTPGLLGGGHGLAAIGPGPWQAEGRDGQISFGLSLLTCDL